jgi:hypothetical protein
MGWSLTTPPLPAYSELSIAANTGLLAAVLRDRQLVEQGQSFILDDLANPGCEFGHF